MEQKTAMWLENNVRFSTGSTIARSEKAMSVVSEGGLSSAGPHSPTLPQHRGIGTKAGYSKDMFKYTSRKYEFGDTEMDGIAD